MPAVVDPVLFAAVQEQLAENRRRSRQRLGGERYLLQGLVVCRRCGYGCHGRPGGGTRRPASRAGYAYYRCSGSDRHRFGGQRMCDNTQVRADLLEAAVWSEVERLLRDPGRIAANTSGASAAAERAASGRGTWRLSRPSCKGCGAGSAG